MQAHTTSDSYLKLRIEDRAVHGQWLLALHDLEMAVGLDVDGDGSITWGELRGRKAEVLHYAVTRLRIEFDGDPLHLRFDPDLQVDQLMNGAYAVLRFSAVVNPRKPDAVTVEYGAFFDVNPLHRGLLLLEQDGQRQQAIFNPADTRLRFECAAPERAAGFLGFLREGIGHIWSGYDHLLFLVTLLLPSVLRRQDGRWVAAGSWRAGFLNVVKIVTAFTVAHSLTLSMATLGVLRFPSRWIEPLIAASILVAALNNLWPVVTTHAWWLAFAFGLLHGFGFATALGELGLSGVALVPTLVAFNLGVELGQLAVVVAFLPMAFAFRRARVYPGFVLQGGSIAVSGVAMWWVVERCLFRM